MPLGEVRSGSKMKRTRLLPVPDLISLGLRGMAQIIGSSRELEVAQQWGEPFSIAPILAQVLR